jgi:hypothetical protein
MNDPRHTVCYVLTSNGADVFADVNFVSALSLRHSNPAVRIVIVCDAETKAGLESSKHALLGQVDEVKSVPTPPASASFRNRFLKTSLRSHLTGPFLYLDADTLIREDIGAVFETDASFAGIPNHNGSGSPDEIQENERNVFHQLGWALPRKHYVNGGALFLSDRPDAYAFGDLWHRSWQECSAKTGRHFDQPSLNRALSESGVNFKWLPGRYNAQVHARPSTAWGAAIWHIYLAGYEASPKTVLHDFLDKTREGSLDSEYVARLCRRVHPWKVGNPVDWLAVQSFRRSRKLLDWDGWELLWMTDHYKQAARSVVRSMKRAALRAWRTARGSSAL